MLPGGAIHALLIATITHAGSGQSRQSGARATQSCDSQNDASFHGWCWRPRLPRS